MNSVESADSRAISVLGGSVTASLGASTESGPYVTKVCTLPSIPIEAGGASFTITVTRFENVIPCFEPDSTVMPISAVAPGAIGSSVHVGSAQLQSLITFSMLCGKEETFLTFTERV